MNLKNISLLALFITSASLHAQYLGHEHEGKVVPILEGETAVIPTFLSTAVALNPDDLRASNVDVVHFDAHYDAGIAMRKKGITEGHYLSPLTVDDGIN